MHYTKQLTIRNFTAAIFSYGDNQSLFSYYILDHNRNKKVSNSNFDSIESVEKDVDLKIKELEDKAQKAN